MNTYKVSETYEIITTESSENGEFGDNGYNFENEDMTAREIAEYLLDNGFIFASSSHYHSGVWFMTEGYTDYHTGETETKSLHFTENMDKRLVKAICKFANIKLIF